MLFRSHRLVNAELVDIKSLPGDQEEIVQKTISNFVAETGSEVGSQLLKNWGSSKKRISLVMPRDYARVLAAMEKAEREGLPSEKVIMEVVNG